MLFYCARSRFFLGRRKRRDHEDAETRGKIRHFTSPSILRVLSDSNILCFVFHDNCSHGVARAFLCYVIAQTRARRKTIRLTRPRELISYRRDKSKSIEKRSITLFYNAHYFSERDETVSNTPLRFTRCKVIR